MGDVNGLTTVHSTTPKAFFVPATVIPKLNRGLEEIRYRCTSPAEYYGPNHPHNVVGRDMGGNDLKVVVADLVLFVIEGEPHRTLLRSLVEAGRWDKLKVVTDARTGRPKLLSFTRPDDYSEGAIQQFQMVE